MRRRIRAISIAAILIGPILVFILLNTGKHHIKKLPYFPTDSIRPNGDTVYRKLPDFKLVDQNGKVFTEDSLRGRIHVADFFFTRCPGICPELSKGMMDVQEKVKDFPSIRLVSYTIDPEYDTPQVLKDYGTRFQAIENKWWFLTGTEAELYRVAKNGYMLPIEKGDSLPELGFAHSGFVVLVDKDLYIRGYYKGINDEFGTNQLKTLLEDIGVLMHEYAEKEKDQQ